MEMSYRGKPVFTLKRLLNQKTVLLDNISDTPRDRLTVITKMSGSSMGMLFDDFQKQFPTITFEKTGTTGEAAIWLNAMKASEFRAQNFPATGLNSFITINNSEKRIASWTIRAQYTPDLLKTCISVFTDVYGTTYKESTATFFWWSGITDNQYFIGVQTAEINTEEKGFINLIWRSNINLPEDI
jgi:hypothetical protein